MGIRFRWNGYACWEIQLPSGKVWLTDPYIDHCPTCKISYTQLTGADYITVSHAHADHSQDVGAVAGRFDSKIYASPEAVEWMKFYFDLPEGRFVRTAHQQSYMLEGGEKLTTFKGRHIDVPAVYRRQYKQVTGKESDPKWTDQEVTQNLMALSRRRTEQAARPAAPPPVLPPEEQELRRRYSARSAMNADHQRTYLLETTDNMRIYFYEGGIEQDLIDIVKENVRSNVTIMMCNRANEPEYGHMAALTGAEIVMANHHDNTPNDHATYLTANIMFDHTVKENPRAKPFNPIRGQWYELGIGVAAAGAAL